jgi:hypothetical protein
MFLDFLFFSFFPERCLYRGIVQTARKSGKCRSLGDYPASKPVHEESNDLSWTLRKTATASLQRPSSCCRNGATGSTVWQRQTLDHSSRQADALCTVTRKLQLGVIKDYTSSASKTSTQSRCVVKSFCCKSLSVTFTPFLFCIAWRPIFRTNYISLFPIDFLE